MPLGLEGLCGGRGRRGSRASRASDAQTRVPALDPRVDVIAAICDIRACLGNRLVDPKLLLTSQSGLDVAEVPEGDLGATSRVLVPRGDQVGKGRAEHADGNR